MKRIVLGVMFTLLIGLASISGYVLVTDAATAQSANNWWATAGGEEGYLKAEWGTGKGPGVSLDAFIESIPRTCDIQIIELNETAWGAMYRCPD